ncbi:hypothetical protein BH09ACT11_BH09ACT11_03030 [soil metagenome]
MLVPVTPRGTNTLVGTLVGLCSQLLVFAVVLAALVPAASVMTLDFVAEAPAAGSSSSASFAAYRKANSKVSKVPIAPVEPTVTEHQMTADSSAPARGSRPLLGATAVRRGGSAVVTSAPAAVSGYGLIGVTWSPGDDVPEGSVDLEFRTATDGVWSAWEPLTYHDEHGADPGSKEAGDSRPGTDEQVVGDVDLVQVRSTSADPLDDMSLAVVDPGAATATADQTPALNPGSVSEPDPSPSPVPGSDEENDAATLSASVFTASPKIYSRSQWGADESIRKKVLLYGEVHAGFVHHTASGNDYTRAEVPSIIRSIYAYHVKSRGWNDIGYNYLVDRFGRIWEGRYGGINRAVVGAHTEGYNSDAFAMSAIGNYDLKEPSSAMIQAYGLLFGWKLSLHGVSADSTRQYVSSRYFQGINGHRDASSTACPGQYLYAKLARIRTLAAEAQKSFSGRERAVRLTADNYPDVIARRKSDAKVFTVPTGGQSGFNPARQALSRIGSAQVVPTPTVTGDAKADLVQIEPDGSVHLRAGDGAGSFRHGEGTLRALAGHNLIAAAGDITGDGKNDLVGRAVSTGLLVIFAGDGAGAFKAYPTEVDISGLRRLAGVGDFDSDSNPDLIGGRGKRLFLYPGTAKGTITSRTPVEGKWKQYSSITGMGDFTGDGKPDLVVRTSADGLGYVLPGRGDGSVASRLGPYTKFTNMDTVVGATQIVAGKRPDPVAMRGSKVFVVPNNDRLDLRKPIYAGFKAARANLILNVGDWNRDGYNDVVIRMDSGVLKIRSGKGNGRFGESRTLAKGFGNVRLLAAVGDMTGDGYPDLMGQRSGGSMQIFAGLPNGGLGSGYGAHSAISAATQIGVGRWDGDGAPDSLFRTDARLTMFPGNGPGGLTSGSKGLKADVSRFDWLLGVSDITGGSGHADVIARSKVTGNLYLLAGSASGLADPRLLGEGFGAYDLAG